MVCNGNIYEAAYTKIIKSAFIKQNQLLFQDGILGEDTEWMIRVYRRDPRICFCDANLYMYRLGREGAITNTISRKNIDDLITVINQSGDYYKKKENQKEIFKIEELGHCATLWFIALSMVPEITEYQVRCELETSLKNINWVTSYRLSKKAKISYIANKILGIHLNGKLLHFYSKYLRIKLNTVRLNLS